MIVPENLVFKGTTISNKQYFVFGKPINWRDGDNVELVMSIYINDDFMVLIKGVEQNLDMGEIDDDSEATYSDEEENNDDNSPEIPYDDENVNPSFSDGVNNDEDDPKTTYEC